MSIYRVSGTSRYREHEVGELFEAVLDLAVEERAVARGDIEVIDVKPPTLQPGSWQMPDGWPLPAIHTQEG